MKIESEPHHFAPTIVHISKIAEEKCNGDPEPELVMFGDALRSKSKSKNITLAECLSREKALESSHQTYDLVISDSLIDNHRENAVAPSYVPLPEFEIVGEKYVNTERAFVPIEQPNIICFEREEKQVIKDIGIDDGVHSSSSVYLHKDMEKSENFLTVFPGEEFICAPNVVHGSDRLQAPFLSKNPFLADAQEVSIHDYTKCVRTTVEPSDSVDKDSDNLSDEEMNCLVLPLGQDDGRDLLEVPSSETECANHGKTPSTSNDILPPSLNVLGHTGLEAKSIIGEKIQSVDSSNSGSQDFPNQGALEPETSASSGRHRGESGCIDELQDTAYPVDKQNTEGIVAGVANLTLPMPNKETTVVTGLLQREHIMAIESNNDNFPTALRNPFLHSDYAEDSIYGPRVLSDRISYTGNASTYSGSISIRSDSSTTSTRSFAFPVLQTEWNSSPVKMAKGERRHYRKCRGWSSRILCCRF